jgi:putative peptidoglycan lipid II flippase
VFRIISKLIGIKFVASLFGLIYSILQVRYFKATSIVDSFFIASAAVNMIISLTQGGQLAETILPEYIKHRDNKGKDFADLFFSIVLIRIAIIVSIILIICWFISAPIINVIGSGLSEESKDLAVAIFSMNIWLVLFTIINSFVNTLMLAYRIYGRSELVGLINNVVSLSLLILFHNKFGVWILVYSLIFGKFIELVVSIFFLRKSGFKFSFKITAEDISLTPLFNILATTSKYVISTQVYIGTINYVASFLPPGTVSIFNYVQQLSSKASNMIIIPVSNVLFSEISGMVKEGVGKISGFILRPLQNLILFTTLVFGVVMLSSDLILSILWGNDSINFELFDLGNTMLKLCFFGFVFFSIGIIFRKCAISLGSSIQLYQLWTYGQLFSAILTFLLVRFFSEYGLACVLLLNMSIMAGISLFISRKSGVPDDYFFNRLFSRDFIFSIICILIATFLIWSITYNHKYFNLYLDLILRISLFVILLVSLLATFYRFDLKRFKNFITG